MKGISLWQPWATAMAMGWKSNETRHWSTEYRGLIAIHAAKRWTWDERDDWEMAQRRYPDLTLPDVPPLGAIVAVGNLVAIERSEDLIGKISAEEESWGNYGPGRFAWITRDIRALRNPVACRGMQSIWTIDPEIEAIVRAQL